MNNKHKIIIYFGITIFIILYFMIKFQDEECQIIPRSDTYIVDKNVDKDWNNEYVRGYHKIICQCPTIYFDSFVYYDDKLVSHTNSLWSDTYFLNCNREILSTMTTGNYFRTRIRGVEIFVSYLFKDKNGKIIGYSDARYELSDIITIKDVSGYQIAILEKTQLDIGWTWTINVINQNHTLSDPSILLALVGKREFRESKIDGCNFIILFISLFIILLCIIMTLTHIKVYIEGPNSRLNHSLFE